MTSFHMEDPPIFTPSTSTLTSARPSSFVSSSPVPKSTKRDPFTTGLVVFTIFAMLSFGAAIVCLSKMD